MIVLISGLPRSGKSSFADRLEVEKGFTHVPLDRYIKEVPIGMTFLEWVATPECIDWPLLGVHLDHLGQGNPCFTPLPDWQQGGKRKSQGGLKGGGRRMNPALCGYVIPGCHAFRIPGPRESVYKVFIKTPHPTIAERISRRPASEQEVHGILDKHLSKDWRTIETYSEEADLILSGTDDPQSQMRSFVDQFTKHTEQSASATPNGCL
jgi:uridine kinase